MVSFDSELRSLVEKWLDRGEPFEDIVQGLKNELESIRDCLRTGKDRVDD